MFELLGILCMQSDKAEKASFTFLPEAKIVKSGGNYRFIVQMRGKHCHVSSVRVINVKAFSAVHE